MKEDFAGRSILESIKNSSFEQKSSFILGVGYAHGTVFAHLGELLDKAGKGSSYEGAKALEVVIRSIKEQMEDFKKEINTWS